MDDDMMAAMGFAGFGKAAKRPALDPKRFDKSKRADVSPSDFFRSSALGFLPILIRATGA